MLCWFLLHNITNQLSPYVPALKSLPLLWVVTVFQAGLCFIAPSTSYLSSLFYSWQYIHVNATFSIRPTRLSPAVSISPISVSPFLPCRQVYQYHFSRFHICGLIYYIFLFLTLLCVTGSGFIHLITTKICSFLWLGNIPLYICTTIYP